MKRLQVVTEMHFTGRSLIKECVNDEKLVWNTFFNSLITLVPCFVLVSEDEQAKTWLNISD